VKGIKIKKTDDSFEMTIRWWNHYNRSLFNILSLGDIIDNEFFWIILSYVFTQTKITTNGRRLHIEHKPFDLLPNTFYELSKVNSFFVEKIESKFYENKKGMGLKAELINHEKHLLLYHFKADTLYFIEKELNSFLRKTL